MLYINYNLYDINDEYIVIITIVYKLHQYIGILNYFKKNILKRNLNFTFSKHHLIVDIKEQKF